MISLVRRSLWITAVLMAPMAQAQPVDRHSFALTVRGFPAGTITTQARKSDTAYAISGAVRASALLRAIRDIGYTGSTTGRLRDGAYVPGEYNGDTNTGSRHSIVKMRYVNGRPVVDSYQPARARRDYDIDPGAQSGTVDLLTAAHSVFEDQAADTLCDRATHMFDGRRRSILSLAEPVLTDGGATCAGTYTRVAGFSPANMQKRVNFPFTLVYDRLDDGTYRLMSFSATTSVGKATARRR